MQQLVLSGNNVLELAQMLNNNNAGFALHTSFSSFLQAKIRVDASWNATTKKYLNDRKIIKYFSDPAVIAAKWQISDSKEAEFPIIATEWFLGNPSCRKDLATAWDKLKVINIM